jgi:hypothetical protein
VNDENLKPLNKRTKSEQREIARKGGKASGESRRRKANLRKAVNAALLDKHMSLNGKELTGEELLAAALFISASDPNNRNQVGAAKLIVQLIDQDKSAADVKEQKARIEKLKADARRTETAGDYAAGDDPISAAIKGEFDFEQGK